MKKKPTAPIKSSTQQFIEIEAIKDDVLMLKDRSCCIIIQSGTVNFGLLSEEEQRSIIYSFSSLLNSLSFPIQILIMSKKMDISSYLDYLDDKITHQLNDVLKKRLAGYKSFIKSIVKINTILEKNFYLVIPFSPLEMGVSGAKASRAKNEYIFTRAKAALYPKRDNLIRLLERSGLGGKVLFEQEIAELYYNQYNPSATGRKLAPINNYTDVVSTS